MQNNRHQGYITPDISYHIHNNRRIKNKTAQTVTYILLLIIISLVSFYLYSNEEIITKISEIIKKMCNSQSVSENSNYATNIARKHASNIASVLSQYKTKNKHLPSNELFF